MENMSKTYEVTTKINGLGIMVKEIEALNLLAAQSMVLNDWKVKISQMLQRENYTQSVEEGEKLNFLRMTMQDKWEIVIIEK